MSENIKKTITRSDVFCQSVLLHTVQMARIFEDSKTFVDMKMKYTPAEIIEKFDTLMCQTEQNPSKDDIRQFVSANFEKNDLEFVDWDPQDWKEEPSFLDKIPNKEYKLFGNTLHKIWKKLGRKYSDKLKDEIDRCSLIWVPNPVIVPGGRFREFYYWDSYWIIKGLLVSEMYTTVKGMLNNYLYIVNEHGYVPNGGRIYYFGRSQPPMLISCFKLYWDAKNDIDFLNASIQTLEKEFNFWLTKRMKVVESKGKKYELATYGNSAETPRPESYTEDMELIASFKIDQDQSSFYNEIRAACESGWDFSSRWFVNDGTNKGSLRDIKTTTIVPVDLNSILYGNAVILSDFHKQLKNFEKAEYYGKLADQWCEAVHDVLWHEDVGTWLDYDLVNKKRRDYFHSSNLAPLWTGCYDKNMEDNIVEKNLRYLESKDIFNFPGGIPQTLENTGEQWDFPNAWPPSQNIIISGLRNTNNAKAHAVAKELATKWLSTNYEAFLKNKTMAEKYNATLVAEIGGGGEYSVQFGFGWTNGVILDILVNYFSE